MDVDALLRSLWASLCQLIYKIIAFLYELFMNLASAKLLTQPYLKPIYQRVTLILSIIMVFYVTLEVVKYVVSPDKMTDKEKGATNVIRNMIIVVALIAFVPTIFEKAYDLQNVLIKNQVFSKIILGREGIEMEKVGKEFASETFSLFYGYDDSYWESKGLTADKLDCEGLECKQVVGLNLSSLAEYGEMPYIHMGLNKTHAVTLTQGKTQNVRVITFDGLLAVIFGVFVCYVLLLYCIDVGVRIVQLLFLQVIAPIPIIGYLTPKKDGIFQKWAKQCVTTYLDLFIRLIVIYFVLLIVEILAEARHSGALLNNVESVSGTMLTFMYIAIIMGLLLFAQKAPKMLQELFPKMGAASGNFGLKAGERVAPAAARTIGGSIGLARGLVGGAIRRNRWRVARNKANGWTTGLKRFTKAGRANNRMKREEIERHKAEASFAKLQQKDEQRMNKQKEKFDSAKAAWNSKVQSNGKIQDLQKQIREAHTKGDKAKAKELGEQLQKEYKSLQNSPEYRRWNAARNKMANSAMAQEMRRKNKETYEKNKAEIDAADRQVRDAGFGLGAAMDKQRTVMQKREEASGRLAAAKKEYDAAVASRDSNRINAAYSNMMTARREFEAADKEARSVFGGRDMAINERNKAETELNAARAELQAAHASGNSEKIAAAQARVAAAQSKYDAADSKVNSIVNESAAVLNARDEKDAAHAELQAAYASGDSEKIAAAQARVDAAERNYAEAQNRASGQTSLFDNFAAASKERRDADQELRDALNSGDPSRIEGAQRRVAAAEKNYEEANKKLTDSNKEYVDANSKLTTAKNNYVDAYKPINEQIKSNQEYFSGNAKDQYGERLQELANNVKRTEEQVIDDKNKHFQGFVGSAVSTVAGAVKVGATGAKAKKLEEINKQVTQGVKNDIATVKAVQKYYDDGGTGWVDRTIQQVDKKMGMPTKYERTMLDIHSYDSKIKAAGAQADLAKSYSSAADSTEDRFRNKAQDSGTKVTADTKIKTGLKDANNQDIYAEVVPGETLGSVVRRYDQAAVTAHAEQEAATKRRDDFKAQHMTLLSAYENMSETDRAAMSDEDKAIVAEAALYDQNVKDASEKESNAKYAAENVKKNAGRYDVVQVMALLAQGKDKEALKKDPYGFDGAGVENAWNLFERMKIIRQNPDMVAAMRRYLSDNPGYFDMFMTGKIVAEDSNKAWKAFDTINNASKAITNEYERQKSEYSETQRNVQTSNKTSAEKAAQDYNGGGSGK